MLMNKRLSSGEGSWNAFPGQLLFLHQCFEKSLFSKAVKSLFLRKDECCKEAERFLEAVCGKQ